MNRYGFSLGMVRGLRFGGARAIRPASNTFCHVHGWLGKLSTELLIDLILFTTDGPAATPRQTQRIATSTAHWLNTPRQGAGRMPSQRWVANTCKHHAMMSPDGVVLDPMASRTPVFAKLCAKMSKGSGIGR